MYNGTYFENVIINKTIYLIGETRENTIIDGGSSEDVLFVSSDGVTISGFTLQNGGLFNYTYSGIILHFCNNSTIMDNIIASNFGRSIYLSNSSNNTVTGNSILHNSYCIYLSYSNKNTITHNNVSNNFEGVTLSYSNNNIIEGNTISNNAYGMFLDSSSNNNIMGNNVSNHHRSIFILNHGHNNHLYHNNLINSTHNAYDDGENTWDNGYPSGGNYWDSYTGNDMFWGQNQTINGSDGVGDTPYDIAADGNKDRYPLMEPYSMTTLSLEFHGGFFKYYVSIKNTGNITAFNVSWDTEIIGPLVLFGKQSSGTLPKPLRAGEETQVPSRFLLGFGSIMITMAIWADNAPYTSKSTPGKLLLFFIKI